jgi:hypothetical protein
MVRTRFRFLDFIHRIHSIDDQVEQNLLELHAIAGDGRQVFRQSVRIVTWRAADS